MPPPCNFLTFTFVGQTSVQFSRCQLLRKQCRITSCQSWVRWLRPSGLRRPQTKPVLQDVHEFATTHHSGILRDVFFCLSQLLFESELKMHRVNSADKCSGHGLSGHVCTSLDWYFMANCLHLLLHLLAATFGRCGRLFFLPEGRTHQAYISRAGVGFSSHDYQPAPLQQIISLRGSRVQAELMYKSIHADQWHNQYLL